jgi:hypothetical protein
MEYSPDGEHALISYFPADLERVTSGTPWFTCILDTYSGTCRELESQGYGAKWIDDQFISWLNAQSESYLIDISALEQIPLMLTVSSVALIPNQPHHAILSGTGGWNERKGLFILNLDGFAVTPYDLNADYISFPASFSNLRFSPDNRYLFFTSLEDAYVVDFATGNLYAQIRNIRDAQWMPDSRTIVGLQHMAGMEDNTAAVVRYSFDTRGQISLTTTEEASSLFVVP